VTAPPASTDALLGELRHLVRRVLSGRGTSVDARRLATVARELDAALSAGGALPVAWLRAKP
jgi:hypothetical protein